MGVSRRFFRQIRHLQPSAGVPDINLDNSGAGPGSEKSQLLEAESAKTAELTQPELKKTEPKKPEPKQPELVPLEFRKPGVDGIEVTSTAAPSPTDVSVVASQGAAEDAKLAIILEYSGAAIFQFRVYANATWICDYASPGCAELLGCGVEALRQQVGFWPAQILPEDWQIVEPAIVQLLVNAQAATPQFQRVRLEYRFYRQDGTLVRVAAQLTCRYLPQVAHWSLTVVQMEISHPQPLVAMPMSPHGTYGLQTPQTQQLQAQQVNQTVQLPNEAFVS